MIYINKLIHEFIKYPEEQLRIYILDIIFASFTKLKEHTLQWLENVLQEVPDGILNLSEKQDMLRALNDIDVSNLKKKNKDEEESEKIQKLSERFSSIFDFFEFR